jgi:hypothetical protein
VCGKNRSTSYVRPSCTQLAQPLPLSLQPHQFMAAPANAALAFVAYLINVNAPWQQDGEWPPEAGFNDAARAAFTRLGRQGGVPTPLLLDAEGKPRYTIPPFDRMRGYKHKRSLFDGTLDPLLNDLKMLAHLANGLPKHALMLPASAQFMQGWNACRDRWVEHFEGAITAEEMELAMCILYPPHWPGAGWNNSPCLKINELPVGATVTGTVRGTYKHPQEQAKPYMRVHVGQQHSVHAHRLVSLLVGGFPANRRSPGPHDKPPSQWPCMHLCNTPTCVNWLHVLFATDKANAEHCKDTASEPGFNPETMPADRKAHWLGLWKQAVYNAERIDQLPVFPPTALYEHPAQQG